MEEEVEVNEDLHVMIDLETMGMGPFSAILSIGAVKFNPYDPDYLRDEFYCAIDLQSCQNRGLHIDADTVMWWLHKDRAEARERLLSDVKIDLDSALNGFSQWFGSQSVPTWALGADFDLVLLGCAYRICGDRAPWSYKDQRCFRTIRAAFPGSVPPKIGVAHTALDDARAQTKHLCDIVRHHQILV